MRSLRISRLNRREWIETPVIFPFFPSLRRISRLNRREWIETRNGSSTTSHNRRISRLNRREWIETGSTLLAMCPASVHLPA